MTGSAPEPDGPAQPVAVALDERDLVLQLIFTPGTFRYLHAFTTSLVDRCDARFRLVANGCPPDEVAAIRTYADHLSGRAEWCKLSSDAMVPHGVALDELYDSYDDGACFCFVDTDVKARGPFLGEFVERLGRDAAVTSGRVAWADEAVLPAGARDLAGRHFVDADGFVYGSSYVAFYRRAPLDEVRARYGTSFAATAHTALSAEVRGELERLGRTFDHYDTAKVLNLLLHVCGYSVDHFDHDYLLHVGGISQYLSHPRAPGVAPGATAGARPWFATSPEGARRWDFAQWTAATLASLIDGEPPPPLPAADPERAAEVRRELADLVDADRSR